MTNLKWVVSLLLCMLFSMSQAYAERGPVCSADAGETNPPFGLVNQAPAVESWKRLTSLPEGCLVVLPSAAKLTVALAGSFSHAGTIDELIAKFGAISGLKGLVYWSVSHQQWRTLITDAYALESPDAGLSREDFSVTELRSGRMLYFAKNDSSSWGDHVFSMRVIDSSDDHLSVETRNVSAIRLGPLTVFQPEHLRSVVLVNRMHDETWSYYSLGVVMDSKVATPLRSLVNRQAAYFRLLAGQPADRTPPLAP